MPATTKRVHFNIPLTPSPALSNASLPSSDGPGTPPDHLQALYASPLKQQPFLVDSPASLASFGSLPYVSGPVRVHPALASPNAQLAWDMAQPSSTAYLFGTAPPLNSALLNQPATYPALPTLTLICDMLPWSITVTPSAGRSALVTLGDVLHALYRTLRLPVSEVELSILPPDGQARVHAAYFARHKLIADERLRKEEHAKGIKRVDFLMEFRRFAGLSMVVGGPALNGKGLGEVWAVHLALA